MNLQMFFISKFTCWTQDDCNVAESPFSGYIHWRFQFSSSKFSPSADEKENILFCVNLSMRIILQSEGQTAIH